jgi:hypothetical protein
MSVPPGAVAIVVGIDGYPNHPLTSAENDARAFRDALLKHDLVDPDKIKFIVGPAATKQGILDAIHPYYIGASVPRFIFFFAGHGCMGYVDPARSRTHSTLAPVEFDHFRHADLLIDIDEIAERMRVAGPQEQFFFIDACRDIPYEKVPNISPIPWEAATPGLPRAQAVVYAVSPFGQAVGMKGGLGVMTGHIVSALDGDGRALDFSPDSNDYVITANSVTAYAAEKVGRAVRGEDQWEQKYRIPELRPSGPPTKPLRVVAMVQPVRITVHIEPDAAAIQTEVTLSQGRVVAQRWPPNQNHVPVTVQPQRHFLEATSTAGQVDPTRLSIDVREHSQATVRVSAGGAGGPKGPQMSEPGGTTLVTAETMRGESRTSTPVESGRIRAEAREPQVAIKVEGLQPPYVRHAGRAKLSVKVAAGPYSVSFRLGSDVFSEAQVEVRARETVTVRPTVAGSALLREVLGDGSREESTYISESIGPIQAGVVPTMLPMIGLKLFDVQQDLFGKFAGVVPALDPRQFGGTPVALVVVTDGDGWRKPRNEILAGMRFEIGRAGAGAAPPVVQRLAGSGFDRIVVVVAGAPGSSFFVRISSPHVGRVLVASASLRGRATIMTARFTPEGRLDLSQNLLRLPGAVYDEPDPSVSPGRMIRQLQLGQQLYQSGELTSAEFRGDDLELIEMLFNAKWTDPILSCMAFYALRDAARSHANTPEAHEARNRYDQFVPEVASNLMRYFPDLPDSRIVHAVALGDTSRLDAMLAAGEVPVLARSAVELAAYAEQRTSAPPSSGRSLSDQIALGPTSISEFAQSMPVSSVWSLLREVPSSHDAEGRLPIGSR